MTTAPGQGADGPEEDATAPAVTDPPLPRDPPPPPGWEDPFEGSAVLHDLKVASEDAPARSGDARPDEGEGTGTDERSGR